MNSGPPNSQAPCKQPFRSHNAGHRNISSSSSSSEEDVVKEPSSTDSTKPSPTNPNLLADLKSVKIDKTNYHHYGHHSSMTAQSLEKIISEGQKLEKEQNNLTHRLPHTTANTPNTPDFSLKTSCKSQETKESLLSHILQVDEKSLSSYSPDTINEIIRYKTEQEITKQQELKRDFAKCTLELLRTAQNLNISAELIPFLFINDTKVEQLKNTINSLNVDSTGLIGHIEQGALSAMKKRNRSLTSIPDEEKKNIASPMAPPAETSPNEVSHDIKTSEPNIDKDNSPKINNAKPVLLPLPATSTYKNQSPQYPSYYNQNSSVSEPKYLGSPYTQKNLTPNVSHAPGGSSSSQLSSPPMSTQTHCSNQSKSQNPSPIPSRDPSSVHISPRQYQQLHPQWVMQQGQTMKNGPYQYYMATTPPKQFMVPPISSLYPGAGAESHPQYVQIPNSNLEEKTQKVPGGGSILRFDNQVEEPPAKKAKPASKPGNINFMISTPENPPVKKTK